MVTHAELYEFITMLTQVLSLAVLIITAIIAAKKK